MAAKTADRRGRYRRGRFAEAICAWHLRCRGYRVLARRFRSPVGEIDLVVRRGRVVAFVEVKARHRFEVALESVSARQRARIRRAAELFLSRRPALDGLDLRFDVMVVVPWALPRHIIDAWRE